MNFTVFFKLEAQIDLEEAAVWYEEQRIGLGKEFIEAVLNEVERLKFYPFVFPNRYLNTREFKMKRFPYIIIYLIEEDRIFIVSIFHSHRNPDEKY